MVQTAFFVYKKALKYCFQWVVVRSIENIEHAVFTGYMRFSLVKNGVKMLLNYGQVTCFVLL